MKKLTILLYIFGIIGLSTFLSCQTASKTSTPKLLKFNLDKDRGYEYNAVWDMVTDVMGQKSDVTVDATYSMNVTADDGQVKTLTAMYKQMRMKMKVMGMTLEMDSEKPVTADDSVNMENPLSSMNKMISELTGKPFTMKVDAEGNILEINGFDAIIRGMIESLKMDEDARQKALASMKDQFNENELKDQFAQIFSIFPNKEVKVGDSWEKKFTAGGKMKATFTTTYTVDDIEGELVTLKTKGRIEPVAGGLEIQGEQTGNVVVNSKTGLLVNAEYVQDIKGEVEGRPISISGTGKIKGKAN